MSEPRATTEPPLPAAIREQLEHMLARPPFDRSPVLSRLLAHVVERSLRVDARAAKEYTLGVEVFGRADDFDPRIDTIVRVQARRLRDTLTRYYARDGQRDPIRLEMPKGQYGIQASLHGMAADAPAERDATRLADANSTFVAASLPIPRTPLIGREEALHQLAARLQDERVRLLTITGVGGTGKTRLGLALAAKMCAAYPGGVWMLDLTAVTNRATLLDALADLFAVRHAHGQPLSAAIADRLRKTVTHPLLLVLDNAEGILAASDVLGDLLDASEMVNILATSRVALRLYGEFEYPLPPLTVPAADWRQQGTDLATVPSVQLFLSRAAAANPHADLGQDADALAELCVRLDGLPLAIELVAAQAGAMSSRQMLKRFTGHLDLPENPACDAPSRQRTLRRTIDWSFDLLDDAGQHLLRRLAVFVGGFTLDAAQAVADASGDLGDRLMPALNALLATGLVVFRTPDDEPRYAMLEILRVYGLERLAASADVGVINKAHAAYYLVLAEEGIGTLSIGERERWLARCDREQDNFRYALDYLLRNGPAAWCLRLGHALFLYWERREKLLEGQRQLQRIVDSVPAATDAKLWARIGNYEATMATFLGRLADAHERYAQILELYRQIEDSRGEAMTLMAMGLNLRFLGDKTGARDCFAQALELCRRVGDAKEIAGSMSNLADAEMKLGNTSAAARWLHQAHDLFVGEADPLSAAWCTNHLGDVARAADDYANAQTHYADAEAEFLHLGDAWGLARTKADRGLLALDSGNPQSAWPLLLDALARFEALDHRRGLVKLAERLADYVQHAGATQLSVKLLAAAAAWRSTLGFAAGSGEHQAKVQDLLRRARESLGDAAFEAMQQAGSHMTVSDIAQAIRSLAENAGNRVTRS